jgi:opacity protein-like surface antigen
MKVGTMNPIIKLFICAALLILPLSIKAKDFEIGVFVGRTNFGKIDEAWINSSSKTSKQIIPFELDNSFAINAFVSYEVIPHIITTFDFHYNTKSEARYAIAQESSTFDVSTMAFLVNVLYEIKIDKVAPYLGVGFGLGLVSADNIQQEHPSGINKVFTEDSTEKNMAWQIVFGCKFYINETFYLNGRFKHFNFGKSKIKRKDNREEGSEEGVNGQSYLLGLGTYI